MIITAKLPITQHIRFGSFRASPFGTLLPLVATAYMLGPIPKMTLRLNALKNTVSNRYYKRNIHKEWEVVKRGVGVHILAIGLAAEQASALNIIEIFPDIRYYKAKRHFGYQANERLKPKMPLKGHFAHPPARWR